MSLSIIFQHIKSIVLVDKVRVVNALIGFSRLTPVSSTEDHGYVDIKEKETRWYPAYEVKGEGIFIEFIQEDIDKWVKSCPEVSERCARLQQNYDYSFIGRNHPKDITPQNGYVTYSVTHFDFSIEFRMWIQYCILK